MSAENVVIAVGGRPRYPDVSALHSLNLSSFDVSPIAQMENP